MPSLLRSSSRNTSPRSRRDSRVATGTSVETLEVRWMLSASGASTYDTLPAPALTALDTYVAAPDSSYSWTLASTIDGPDYTGYILNLTSQTWRTTAEVNRTTWQHWLQVIVPDTLTSSTAVLKVSSGSNSANPPTSLDGQGIQYATSLNSVAVVLPTVPNQSLIFTDDGTSRVEDEIISYTFDKYLDGGDANWPLLLPMVKSAVRAMDATQAFTASRFSGTVDVDDFIVTGASKRGWTTWLTPAVDNRVRAIVPMVFDALNLGVQMPHHKDIYVGVTQNIVDGYSDSIHDYADFDIFDRIQTPRGQDLLKIVDPYQYLDRSNYLKPKYSVVASGDEFFVSDSTQYYINDLPGVNYLRIVPNTDHGLSNDALQGAIAFEKAIITNTALPTFSWDVIDAGSTIVLNTQETPTSVKLWKATNTATRDFRKDTVGSIWSSTDLSDQGGGIYSAHVDPPQTGAVAFFVEMTYVINGITLVFTTEARELPRFIPTVHVTLAEPPQLGVPLQPQADAVGIAGGNVPGTFSFVYHVGNSASGPGSTAPPVAPGTYTVVAHFTSDDLSYSDSQSSPLTFTIFPTLSEIGVFREGRFYLDANGNTSWNSPPAGGDAVYKFGVTGDLPISGDWDGDGYSQIGVFRGINFYLDWNSDGRFKWEDDDRRYDAGYWNALPVVGDWNGDGKDDLGVFSDGVFRLDGNGDFRITDPSKGDPFFKFGAVTDLPVAGDWNGDGVTDIGVYRSGIFYLDANGNGKWDNTTGGDLKIKFGTSGDIPLIGDWNGDGTSDLGVVRAGYFYLDGNGNRAWDNTTGGDLRRRFGNPGDLPVAGIWAAPPAPSSPPAAASSPSLVKVPETMMSFSNPSPNLASQISSLRTSSTRTEPANLPAQSSLPLVPSVTESNSFPSEGAELPLWIDRVFAEIL